jgi:hypothetical protein
VILTFGLQPVANVFALQTFSSFPLGATIASEQVH